MAEGLRGGKASTASGSRRAAPSWCPTEDGRLRHLTRIRPCRPTQSGICSSIRCFRWPSAISDISCCMPAPSRCRRPGPGVAFIGPAGAGKSTLTASLTDAGCRLLADDALVVSLGPPLLARPAYPGVRLWPEVALPVYGSERGRRFAASRGVVHRQAPCPRKRILAARGPARAARTRSPVSLSVTTIGWSSSGCGSATRSSRCCRTPTCWTFPTVCGSKRSSCRSAVRCQRFDVRRLSYPRMLDRLGAVRLAIIEDLRRS